MRSNMDLLYKLRVVQAEQAKDGARNPTTIRNSILPTARMSLVAGAFPPSLWIRTQSSQRLNFNLVTP